MKTSITLGGEYGQKHLPPPLSEVIIMKPDNAQASPVQYWKRRKTQRVYTTQHRRGHKLKLYSKRCQYLIQTNQLSISQSHTAYFNSILDALSDQQVSNQAFHSIIGLRDLEILVRGHWKWHHLIDCIRVLYRTDFGFGIGV